MRFVLSPLIPKLTKNILDCAFHERIFRCLKRAHGALYVRVLISKKILFNLKLM